MYEVTVKGGVYATPRGMCVACGGWASGDHVIKKGNSDFQGKTFLNMAFPLCDGCAAVQGKHYERQHDAADQAVLERVEAARKADQPNTLVGFLALVSLPALIVGALWILPLAWWIGVVLAVVIWFAVLGVVFRTKVEADPDDLARLRGIKAEDREWVRRKAEEDRQRRKAIDRCVSVKSVSGSKATFRFGNPVYAHAFAEANLGRATERAA
jgi:hypothetical protein